MSKIYYRIRRTDNLPENQKYTPKMSWADSNTTNYFETLEAAQKAAFEWAAKYQVSYTVVRLEEMGTAAPSAPPVIWTPATNPLVGRYLKHRTDTSATNFYWKIAKVRDNGDYEVVNPDGNSGLIYAHDTSWSVV